MRFSREQYIALLTGEDSSRQMLCELFGLLVGLEGEWAAQGASAGELDLSAFCLDYVPIADCGGHTGQIGGEAPAVIEETAEYVLSRDAYGRTMKLIKAAASIALPLDHPVKTFDDWLKIKHRYRFSDERVDLEQAARAAKLQTEQGALVIANIEGGFDWPRQLMGEEAVCMAYYDQPELIHDMLETIGDTALSVLERISDHVHIDVLTVHEDMAGKAQPLVGPRIIQSFIKPYYRKIWDMLASKGTRIFSQDSDGNMNPAIDAFLDCGVNLFYPCEPAAGMDIVELRKKYGNRIMLKGGIDKHVLRCGKREILAELEYKLQPLMQSGGCVFALDHRITNGTPLENYRYYIDTAREILGREPRAHDEPGWRRMAF